MTDLDDDVEPSEVSVNVFKPSIPQVEGGLIPEKIFIDELLKSRIWYGVNFMPRMRGKDSKNYRRLHDITGQAPFLNGAGMTDELSRGVKTQDIL